MISRRQKGTWRGRIYSHMTKGKRREVEYVFFVCFCFWGFFVCFVCFWGGIYLFTETERGLESVHMWRLQLGQAERKYSPLNEKEGGEFGYQCKGGVAFGARKAEG